ncbi:MAG: hypothetical protein R3266_14725, partial [Gemmatimonadota bacterium]|nr:hypothetical protein [Gemmatimonadota bacterium]
PELPEDPVHTLVTDHQSRGVEPGPWTPSVRWTTELDVPREVWLAATEAGLTGADQRIAAAEEAEEAEL